MRPGASSRSSLRPVPPQGLATTSEIFGDLESGVGENDVGACSLERKQALHQRVGPCESAGVSTRISHPMKGSADGA